MEQSHTFRSSSELYGYLYKLYETGATGDLVLHSGDASGKVYFIGGEVAWAFASGQKVSFQSILLKESITDKDTIIQGIRRSREKGSTNLDDILIQIGINDAGMRANINQRHSKSALLTIGTWKSCVGKFVTHPEPSATPENLLSFRELIPNAETFRSEELETVSAPKESIAPIGNLSALMARLRDEIPYFLGAMIFDAKTGMPVVSLSDVDSLDVEVASAFYRDVIKSAESAQNALNINSKNKSVEEILITTDNDFVILQSLGSTGNYVLYMLLDKTSNPGMARIIIKRYMDTLLNLL